MGDACGCCERFLIFGGWLEIMGYEKSVSDAWKRIVELETSLQEENDED